MTPCLARRVHCVVNIQHFAFNIRLKYNTIYPHEMIPQQLKIQVQKIEHLLRSAGNKDGFIDNGPEVEAALVRLLRCLCFNQC
jgi:hypothetical protein